MLHSIARLILVPALVISIGLHWVVLQSAAWTGMMVEYSLREGSVIEGISQTFDNLHPCALCGAVRQGMQEDNQEQKQQGGVKLLLAWVEMKPVTVTPPVLASTLPFSLFTWTGLETGPPPGPPPRRGVIFSPVG